MIHGGIFHELTGDSIYYYRCTHCKFIFTTAFDKWTASDFCSKIYNDEYGIKYDPEYINGNRARSNARLVIEFAKKEKFVTILDYGGGDGILSCEINKHNGFKAESWDTIADAGKQKPSECYYDLVTAFEVFEHTPNPVATMLEMLSFLKDGGILLFSTLLLDVARQSTDHPYIAPRNGHISLQSKESLNILLSNCNAKLLHSMNGFHVVKKQSDINIKMD